MPYEPASMTPYQNLCERFLLEMLNSYDFDGPTGDGRPFPVSLSFCP